MMNKLKWYAMHGQRQLGWLGLAALALILGVWAWSATLLRQAEYRRDAMTREVREVRAKLRAQSGRGAETGNRDASRGFFEYFPLLSTAPDTIEQIQQIAGREGVTITQIEYRLVMDAGSPLAQYQMELPAKGTYLQVRNFVDAVLLTMPAVALDDIAFDRTNVEGAELTSRLRMTLFVRADG